MAAPTLTDLSYQFSDNGVLLNQDSTQLPFIDVESVSGLDSAPFRESERDSEGWDGGVVEAEFETIRTIEINGTIYATPTTVFDLLDDLKANFAPNTISQPFYFQMPTQEPRMVLCKSLGIKYDLNSAIRLSTTAFQIVLKAYDPTIYSTAVHSTSQSLMAATQDGRGYSRAYPLTYGGTTTTGIFIVNNGGNRPVGGIITIPGPVTNPQVLSDTDGGKFLQIQISLSSTDHLDVDLGSRTILLNGTANRRNQLTSDSQWFRLLPGDNALRYSAATNTASRVEVNWRDGYR